MTVCIGQRPVQSDEGSPWPRSVMGPSTSEIDACKKSPALNVAALRANQELNNGGQLVHAWQGFNHLGVAQGALRVICAHVKWDAGLSDQYCSPP
jgi:hypothetical protein